MTDTDMDWYGILGCRPDATHDELADAYRRLVKKYHPDRTGKDTADAFGKVREAWRILGDPAMRRAYDALPKPVPKRRKKGAPARVDIRLDIRQALYGVDMNVRYAITGEDGGKTTVAAHIMEPGIIADGSVRVMDGGGSYGPGGRGPLIITFRHSYDPSVWRICDDEVLQKLKVPWWECVLGNPAYTVMLPSGEAFTLRIPKGAQAGIWLSEPGLGPDGLSWTFEIRPDMSVRPDGEAKKRLTGYLRKP